MEEMEIDIVAGSGEKNQQPSWARSIVFAAPGEPVREKRLLLDAVAEWFRFAGVAQAARFPDRLAASSRSTEHRLP
jgi:hypothetical protein